MSHMILNRFLAMILLISILFTLVGCASESALPENDTAPVAPVNDDSSSKDNNPPIEPEVPTENNTDKNDDVSGDTVPTEEPVEDEPVVDEPVKTPEDEQLSSTQLNSIAMLNYLASLSQEINDSKNSRLFLEEAYAALINNTNPEAVDEKTEEQLSTLLDIIEDYRMIGVKRDLIQYFYEQNKAVAIKAAVPSVDTLFNLVGEAIEAKFNPLFLVSAVVNLAIDSYSNYSNAGSEMADALANKAYLIDGLSLDDQEAAKLHECRKSTFLYMIDIVRSENLPGYLALNENAVAKFVEWKNKTNNIQKIQFFESEKDTYSAFGSYWLELASCYYEAKEYQKCLDAFSEYENLNVNIFRKDYELAETLPAVIASCSFVYKDDEYVAQAEQYINMLLDNTDRDEWALRFFAAEMLVDLYRRTGSEDYLRQAFNIEIDNVNYLVEEQRKLNFDYLADVKEVEIPSDATKEEKKAIKEYNKALNDLRKVQLPPVYEPLVVNCDLLFAIASKINLSKAEKDKIDGILHGNKAFLTQSLDNMYSFTTTKKTVVAEFDKNKIILPLTCVSENSKIVVSVSESGVTKYEDWVVDKVDRKAASLDEYTVVYKSKKIEKQKWSPDSTVTVEIFEEGSDKATYTIKFKVSKFKDLKVTQTVEFEQTK